MLTPEEDVEITSLRKRGWSISAIARHVGHDRKTVRGYLSGEREVGVRGRAEPDVFDRFESYVRQRLADDQHVWATTLFDEVTALGYERSYQTFTRQLRDRQLRPHCEPCSASIGRAHVDIEHPPGEEIQWDWLELDETPWGEKAYVLVGALAHSSRFRAWFSDSDDQAHLVVGIDEILRRLGGTARRWRVDRMATVINPNTGKLQRSFAPVAKHYGVGVDACPPRHGNRKGVVEKNIDFLTRRWWRTARVGSPTEAQASLDRFCVTTADGRRRDDATVGAVADAEPLLSLPDTPFPAEVVEVRTVAANALISLWGNRYSVPPGLVGAHVQIRWRLGAEVFTVHARGSLVATHQLAPRGAQRTVRLPEHTAALENLVLGAFSTDRPCKRKVNRPPSDAALALAAELLGDQGADPVIDLDTYRRAIEGEESAS
ncbi:MAG TPA: IS21 family transposase [Acidimicrobiales bacterium]|jgi:transposase|nr:IS21 family transposase [Acidimicrobiales bacterium]